MADRLAFAKPGSAYRRVEFDALVLGSDAGQLVRLCFERALTALDRALAADIPSRPRSQALSDALLALTALREGVDRDAPLGASLSEIYTAGCGAVATALVRFDPIPLSALRTDLRELSEALCPA